MRLGKENIVPNLKIPQHREYTMVVKNHGLPTEEKVNTYSTKRVHHIAEKMPGMVTSK